LGFFENCGQQGELLFRLVFPIQVWTDVHFTIDSGS
jgi:hypothetical protein